MGAAPSRGPMTSDGSPIPRFQYQYCSTDSHWNITFPRPQHPRSQEKVLYPWVLWHPGPVWLCPVPRESSQIPICTPLPMSPLYHPQDKNQGKAGPLHPVPG